MNSTLEENIQRSRKIQLDDVTRILVRRNVITIATAKKAMATINTDDERHPFVQLGDLELRDSSNPNVILTSETITRFIAEGCNIPHFRIDPLKIDVETVTGLVSQAYATRFQFLPVSVTDTAQLCQ